MILSLEEIERLIITTITDITGNTITDRQLNLFSEAVNIMPRDMVYVVQAIEDQLELGITSIFDHNDERIMTVHDLSVNIHQLIQTTLSEIYN
ncbi:hypothetical protein J2Z32_000634 [Paenibacillus turicensis]|uniref:Carrier domain-containing protein n=1 Tax=Paenibacillus turicensis TaxID=160487 RepID=A0ABS4FN61_9BACL|nr:hypothetical protein [Paenibacillus turicensis]MBP1904017.1 hypothetical protein [Paenibacillus turicensis]